MRRTLLSALTVCLTALMALVAMPALARAAWTAPETVALSSTSSDTAGLASVELQTAPGCRVLPMGRVGIEPTTYGL